MEKHNHEGGMTSRGVSRPMSHSTHGHDMDRKMMLNQHHEQTLWIYWTIILLGFWMLVSPLTFSYGKDIVQPPGGRTLWLSDDMRVLAMKISDMVSGALLVFFGWRSLTPGKPVSLWIAAFTGIWLNLAPLIFWAPNAMIYVNGTIVGALVIALTILIPGMPNMIMFMKMGSEVPEGWSYNPSSWPQRGIMIALGFLGWLVSRYLGAFQMGYIDLAWDPFFGESTQQVLNSRMSHSLPISDGAFGAFAYTLEFLMGWMGSPSRWRTMPWMVTVFGILVIPLGLVHIFLVISQPVIVGAWCTLCLLAAAIMLPMIPLEFDEVIAMGQHMVQAKRRGDSLWQVFWKGGKPFEQNEDQRSPKISELPRRPLLVYKASIWGMSFPPTLVFSTLIGVAVMFAPAVFGISIETVSSNIFHLSGSLIIVVSVISMGEIVRVGRFLNILLGLILVVGPWFAQDGNTGLNITGTLAGIMVAALSLPRGRITESYGLWNKYVK